MKTYLFFIYFARLVVLIEKDGFRYVLNKDYMRL